MDDFKKLTVKYLRELAKKHLVPGHSRLTKDELIAALKKLVPNALKGEEKEPAPKAAAKKAAAAPKADAKPARGSASGRKTTAIVETEPKKTTVKSLEVRGTTVSRTASKSAEVSTQEIGMAPAKGSKNGNGASKKGAKAVEAPEAKPAPAPAAPAKQPETPRKETAAAERPPAPAPAPATPAPKAAAVAPAPAKQPEPARKETPAPKAAAAAPTPAKPSEPPQEPVSAKAAAPTPARPTEPARKEPAAAPKASAQPLPVVEEKKSAPARESAAAETPSAAPARPAQASPAAAAPVEARQARREESPAARPSEPPRSRRRPVPAAPPEEPLVEGFFVARIAGEGEAWRHHLTESQGRGQFEADEEGLGDLPASYEDDSTVLLLRDPHTLFVFWSFRHETVRAAAEALVSPRAFLRVFEGDTLVREEELQLDSKSFYVHGLPPGRTYRVEAYLVGRDGRSIRLGDPSNPVALPAVGDSDQTQLRFLRVPPGVPLDQIEELMRQGVVKVSEVTGELEVISWERIGLPNSAEMVLQRTRRERGENAERPEHLERPEGMDQGDWASSPSGAGWILR